MKLHCRYEPESNSWTLLDEHGTALTEARQFLEAQQIRGLSPRTIRAYAYDLLMLYRWLEGRVVSSLENADVLEFIKYQRNRGSSARSINRRLTTTRALFRFLTNSELPQSSHVSLPRRSIKSAGRDHRIGLFRLKKPSRRQLTVAVEQRLVEPLTQEQARCFLRSLKRYRDLSIVYLMLLCGLRSHEVLELELPQANLIDGRVRVLGKGNKERIIPLPDMLLSSLSKYLQLERPQNTLCAQLFVVLQGRQLGQPMTPAGLRSLFRHRRGIKLLGELHPHRCRHTFGTEMARQGVRLHTLQKLMGHGDISATMHYITLSMADVAEEYRRATEVIEARLRQDQ